ncbi:hypothetical protein SAMN02745133_00868 [Desulforamulus putei DSM 12395]|uniref:AsnC family protein n=1 Tax=Desulforamulus putei DSM 12395 TaxID=1121429 RepID=A0A1M4VBM7_9FIRM|nr:hypothetical protein [Desulforamulus putei]SHE66248.1 hypothetical protein SAMN02745133_00868 [Desulforamulus putei DSM 12395]
MGLRAYLMVTVHDDVDQQGFVQILRELEEMIEVDFVDPVVGRCDIVIMIEAPVTVQEVANKIEKLPWVKKLETLKIVSLFERHSASKKNFLPLCSTKG